MPLLSTGMFYIDQKKQKPQPARQGVWAWVKAHFRKSKEGLVPVRQHNRVVGFMKESAYKDFQKPYVKPKINERMRLATAKLKMTRIE